MHETKHIVEILAGHRIAGIRHFSHICGRLLNRHIAIQKKNHVGTRAHHFGHDRFGRVEHVVENRALILAQVRIGVDEYAQLSSDTSLSVSFGSKPSMRTIMFVFLPISQIIGLHTFANT